MAAQSLTALQLPAVVAARLHQVAAVVDVSFQQVVHGHHVQPVAVLQHQLAMVDVLFQQAAHGHHVLVKFL